LISNRSEASNFLTEFETYAQWDGEKFYLAIQTVNPVGTLTIMKSEDGKFFYHRKNELYWDLKEIMIDTGVLADIIWVFRTAFNNSIKSVCVTP
jgi:hypothetical protein